MRKIQLTRLNNEISITIGMISELMMKCKMLENQILSDSEGALDIQNTMSKFDTEITKYKRKLDRIQKEIGEINGAYKL